MELQSLDFIRNLASHRHGVGKAQWAHGRYPAETNAKGGSELRKADFLILTKGTTDVGKGKQTQSAVVACPGEWGQHFCIHDNFLGATQIQAVGGIRWAQGRLLEAPDAAQPANEVVFEQGIGSAR